MPKYDVDTDKIRDSAISLQNQSESLENALTTAETNIDPCREMLGGKRLTTNLESWDDLKSNLKKLIDDIPNIVKALNGMAADIDAAMGE